MNKLSLCQTDQEDYFGYIVASHLTWGSVITVAGGHTNGGLGDCGDNDCTPPLRLNTLINPDLT